MGRLWGLAEGVAHAPYVNDSDVDGDTGKDTGGNRAPPGEYARTAHR
jgi:hypothetical protein